MLIGQKIIIIYFPCDVNTVSVYLSDMQINKIKQYHVQDRKGINL